MVVEHAVRSDQGDRPENQDVADCHLNPKEDLFCFALADGLGGHRAGGEAAKLAVETILRHLSQLGGEDIASAISEAFQEANDRIKQASASDPDMDDMHSTGVLAVVKSGAACFASVGDSRGYLIREGEIIHKTRDDSVVQMLLDMGEINPEEAAGHPDRNRILKALGMEGEFRMATPPKCLEVRSGDYILLCSDGFWENFIDSELTKILGPRAKLIPPGKMLDMLFEVAAKRAQDSGKPSDNITAQLVLVR
ncbi:MAG: protein phosphatase 2C domain-containing protein [Desulfarculaceae bacterium]|nr:protein phosphatase 2C domain-containing protein [Desulfarculaceae bacterium]MCF8072138.1 protein phosphatase 2C domain-containing protein [Desulfarculaceae bacterium]MCF8100059.1 protein phosphatase 2C domain-containing protein [Desulfarculaceae bacterium]MCF8118266.1 protein phosphatase 2C domain-containing protein [Desulfarculaceae bacterium]